MSKKNKKFQLVVIITLFGAGIYLLYWYGGITLVHPKAPLSTKTLARNLPFPVAPTSTPTASLEQMDTLRWGMRLMSKGMPKVEGAVIWKVYTNREYGFEMQYPNDWVIDVGSEEAGWQSAEVDKIIYITFDPPYRGYDRLSLTIMRRSSKEKDLVQFLEFLQQQSIQFREDVPIRKYITVNSINWLVENPDEYEMTSDMYTEKDVYIYKFSGTSFPTRNERDIVEYMIKSLRFL